MKMTRDAKAMLFVLYKEYKAKRKQNLSRLEAKFCGSAASIQENLFPDKLLDDIEDFLIELERLGYVENLYADATVYECYLSDLAIATMESQTTDTLLNIADFISKFIP